ncbi:hypothetical protein N7476_001815 [Penicillium atrosanguineum]|uniref:Uncharacterized protein n=1 Tax=Penicillium atrosanguineum TaxID=1132637 RepID=A0A9W9Q2A2_9EURO|nr:hypothetical protein N7476_001815 [Penicillium atrosanguineum]
MPLPLANVHKLAIRDESNDTMSSHDTGIPRPTRYITDTDDDGNSFFYDISLDVKVSTDLGKGASLSLGYNTDVPAPVNLNDHNDLNVYLKAIDNPPPLWTNNGGSNLWFVDTPPGTSSELHRTMSIDFSIQVVGEIELTLSNGDTRLIKPGDVVIQRGTLHKWRNPSSTQWSRFVGINTGSQPIVTKNHGTLPVFL